MDKDKSLNSALILSVLLHIIFILLLGWVAASHSVPKMQSISGGVISAIMVNPQTLPSLKRHEPTAASSQKSDQTLHTAENNTQSTSQASSIPTTNKPALIPAVTKSDSVVMNQVTSVTATKVVSQDKPTQAPPAVTEVKVAPSVAPVVPKMTQAAVTPAPSKKSVKSDEQPVPTQKSDKQKISITTPSIQTGITSSSAKIKEVPQQQPTPVKQVATDHQSQQVTSKKTQQATPKLDKTPPPLAETKQKVPAVTSVTPVSDKSEVKPKKNIAKPLALPPTASTIQPTQQKQVVQSTKAPATKVQQKSVPSASVKTATAPTSKTTAASSTNTTSLTDKQTAVPQKSVTQLTQSESDDPQLSQLFSSLTAAPPLLKVQHSTSQSQSAGEQSNPQQTTANSTASQSELDAYNSALVNAIENQFKNPGLYRGKSCALHIKLASDGLVLSAEAVSGDAALCREALTAIRMAKIPAPFNQGIYDKFKNTTITFKPD